MKEQQAKGMLKAGMQPKEVAFKTGLSLEWIELQARKMGKRPLTMGVVRK